MLGFLGVLMEVAHHLVVLVLGDFAACISLSDYVVRLILVSPVPSRGVPSPSPEDPSSNPEDEEEREDCPYPAEAEEPEGVVSYSCWARDSDEECQCAKDCDNGYY